MRKQFKRVLHMAVVGSALGLVSPAWAQTGSGAPPPPVAPGNAIFMRIGPGPLGGEGGIGFVGFEGPFDQKVVTGAPFTATISQQTTQTLADGNHIVRNTTGSIARDSAGRTRRDMTLPTIGPWTASGKAAPHAILINDPVAGTHYVLDADTKEAHELPRRRERELESGPRENPGFEAEAQRETTTVSLGTQTINGVSAEGTRTIRTIPAGEIGNDKPITITVERWYSPELQTVVLLKHSDPMVGDSVYELTNIQRAEPDATLFQVPADYTIKQGRGMAIRIAPPAPAAAPDSQ